MRLPSSATFPSPTARTLPRCGFSFAVSGRTMPLAVVSSSSTALTISRSPRGLSFMSQPPSKLQLAKLAWHSSKESAKDKPDSPWRAGIAPRQVGSGLLEPDDEAVVRERWRSRVVHLLDRDPHLLVGVVAMPKDLTL